MASTFWESVLNRRSLICIFNGFSSGLPLYILVSLVPAWLRTEGVSLAEIGLFALIQLPYNWKFLWAPLLDRFQLPLLGLRRGWMLVFQIALFISIALLPRLGLTSLGNVACLAFAVAFFSASQDIVLDAYRREILPDNELGFGNSLAVNAYRIAALVPSSLSLILADHFNWNFVFIITALFMAVGIMLTLVIAEPERTYHPHSFKDAVVEPIKEFFGRQGVGSAVLIIAFLFFYKLGDNMATALATPFYIDLGFSLTEIGLIAKNVGLWSTVIGSVIGGLMMIRTGINRALWIFGVIQVVSILGFAALAHIGHNIWVLALVIGFEYIGVGLGASASVAFIARSSDRRFTAFQFALLTAVAALPRTLANSVTGFIVEAIGWELFFYCCTLSALPGMVLLIWVAPWSERHPNK